VILLREIQPAKYFAYDRHDDVLHQRFHNLAERAANDHTNGEIDHAPLDGKFPKFFHH
jgi:hypothetical protein